MALVLESLEVLDLGANENLFNAPEDEAFPVFLGEMESLRVVNLSRCRLRSVPAFIGKLKSLEVLDLSYNLVMICSTLDFLIEGCPSLREMRPREGYLAAYWTSELEHLEAFEARMLVENPKRHGDLLKVISQSEGGAKPFLLRPFFVLLHERCVERERREGGSFVFLCACSVKSVEERDAFFFFEEVEVEEKKWFFTFFFAGKEAATAAMASTNPAPPASSVRVLIAGDVRGNFDALYARVRAVNTKAGPFDALFCVGQFFADDGDFSVFLFGGSSVLSLSPSTPLSLTPPTPCPPLFPLSPHTRQPPSQRKRE